MQEGPELQAAIGQFEGAVHRLGEALHQLREGDQRTVGVAALGDDLEAAGDSYLDVSERIGAGILAGLDESSTDPEGVARMAAAIGMDLKVAEQLVAHAGPEPDESLDEETAGPESYLPALGDPGSFPIEATGDLRDLAGPALAALTGTDDAALAGLPRVGSGGPSVTGQSDAAPTVAKAIDKILADAGATLGQTFASVTWPDATVVPQLAERFLGGRAAEAAERVVGQLRRLWRRLSKLAVKALAAAVRKIESIIGPKLAGQALARARDWITDQWARLTGGNPAGRMLGLVLGRDELAETCAARLSAAEPAKARAAITACEKLAASHDARLGWVRFGNNALSLAGSTAILKVAGGDALIAGVGIILMAYTAWLAHDHLDSRTADFLPRRVDGIRLTVETTSG